MLEDLMVALISGAVLLFLGYCVSVLKGIHDMQVMNTSDHTIFNYRLDKQDIEIDELRETVDIHGDKFVRLENNKKETDYGN